MQILLVNPPMVDVKNRSIPLGLISLGSHIRTLKEFANVNLSIVDLNIEFNLKRAANIDTLVTESAKNIIKRICECEVIIGFYSIISVYPFLLTLSQKIKKLRPGAFIVFGGPQASHTSRETLDVNNNCIDHIIIGEGEFAFSSLLRQYCRKEIHTKFSKGKLIKNLDELPFLDFSLFDLSEYKRFNESSVKFPIEAGRGCPYSCIYCSTSLMWEKRCRLKSVERLVNEMKVYKELYGISDFDLVHDNLVYNRQFVSDLCRHILNERLSFSWHCHSRIDHFDKELVVLMREAGCSSIFIGLESYSRKILKLCNKTVKPSVDFHSQLKILCENSIAPTVSLMTGFPFESRSDTELNLKNAFHSKMYGVANLILSILQPEPKTKILEEYSKKMKFYEPVSFDVSYKLNRKLRKFIKNHPLMLSSFYSLSASNREHLNLHNLQKAFHFFSDYFPKTVFTVCELNNCSYYDFLEIMQSCIVNRSRTLNNCFNKEVRKIIINENYYKAFVSVYNYERETLNYYGVRRKAKIVKHRGLEYHVNTNVGVFKSDCNIVQIINIIANERCDYERFVFEPNHYLFIGGANTVKSYKISPDIYGFISKSDGIDSSVFNKLMEMQIINNCERR